MFNKEYLKLYFIYGTQDIPKNKSIIDVVTEALESGITMFQFREKGEGSLTGNAKIELAQSYSLYVKVTVFLLLLMMM